jgi:hypothetical protein
MEMIVSKDWGCKGAGNVCCGGNRSRDRNGWDGFPQTFLQQNWLDEVQPACAGELVAPWSNFGTRQPHATCTQAQAGRKLPRNNYLLLQEAFLHRTQAA